MTSAPKTAHAEGVEKVKGHLAMLLFAGLIAGSFSIGHMAAPYIAPTALTAVRFVLATVVMAIFGVLLIRQIPVIRDGLWRFPILGGLMAFYFVMMFFGLQIALPVSTGAVFTLIPLMSAGFSWLILRQRTSLNVFFGLLVGALGAVWVIFQGNIEAIMRFEVGRGELIFFLGCVSHALYTPLVRKLNRNEPVFHFTFMTLIGSTVCILVWGFPSILTTDWTNLPIIVWITIAYLGVFTTAGTFFLVQYASMRLPASKVMAYGYLTPGFIAIYEALLGHGWLDVSLLLGIIVTATALVILAITSDS